MRNTSLILLLTTKPSEIIWAFYKFRMPAAVGLAFTAALRFLPQMIERLTVLLQVMQVRGYDLTVPRWWEVKEWPVYGTRAMGRIGEPVTPCILSGKQTKRNSYTRSLARSSSKRFSMI